MAQKTFLLHLINHEQEASKHLLNRSPLHSLLTGKGMESGDPLAASRILNIEQSELRILSIIAVASQLSPSKQL